MPCRRFTVTIGVTPARGRGQLCRLALAARCGAFCGDLFYRGVIVGFAPSVCFHLAGVRTKTRPGCKGVIFLVAFIAFSFEDHSRFILWNYAPVVSGCVGFGFAACFVSTRSPGAAVAA